MKVIAALSGGVDSAVAAARAVEAGYDVTGVHMALKTEGEACATTSRGCANPRDRADAQRTCEILGIPFEVWDLADEFEEKVISDFVSQYEMGRTPNPCVRCNEFVKFKELTVRARERGFDAVVTGHYARSEKRGDRHELLRARDLSKDQSYVLAVMGEEEISRVIFPLGDMPSKQAVREEAEARGLGVSNKPDSFDICFIPDGDTQKFLRERLGEAPGEIVDVDGNVLGAHRGHFEYTVGQRKGLGIDRPAADGRPRYVLETRPSANQVVVGPAELLSVDVVVTADLTWDASDDEGDVRTIEPAPMGTDEDECLYAQMRAHGRPIPVKALERGEGGLKVTLAESVRGIAPGQTLVLYRGNRVLAQSVINGTNRTKLSASTGKLGRRVAEDAVPA
ncbi:MAG: tRNA 2-thiouridine(34) synthase MnmA [Actinomycetaceae bacterium]|nr:tRNA 2-thiouridine(34) synthase MnmA [Actinomycetaceae bacterium]